MMQPNRVLCALSLSLASVACQFDIPVNGELDADTEVEGNAGSRGTDPSAPSNDGAPATDYGPAGGSTGSIFAEPLPARVSGTAGAGGASNGLGDGDLTVLLLLDKSGSMSGTWDGQSKWHTALGSFFGGLEGVEDQVTIGALLFPLAGGCDVPYLSEPGQIQFQSGRDFISTWNEQASQYFPDGSTPLGLAFEQANNAIHEAAEVGLLEERRFRVMVVTDGEPNCGTNPDRLASLASEWREMGVEVHVMGLPGSAAAAQLLDRIAGLGGSTEYVAPTSGDEAEDTFYTVVR